MARLLYTVGPRLLQSSQMANRYASLAADAIAKAAVLQVRALQEIERTEEPAIDQAFDDFVAELDECGHLWGNGACDCAYCARYGQIIQEVLAGVMNG